MGQAKIKQYSREQFLLQHPLCAYCGEPAITTDHCPPRCFFERRNWPESYEFPACDTCNTQGRLDEQALAIVARLRLMDDDKEPGRSEWRKLFRSVLNNQPEIVAEWRELSASGQKRAFRQMFGPNGDDFRRAGWGAIKLGSLSRAAIERFGVKLGKALYYRHIQQLFEGDIHFAHIDPFIKDKNPEYLESLLHLAPEFATPERNARSLADQFIYRFNHNLDLGVIYAIVQFGPQLVFQIMAVSQKLAQELAEDAASSGQTTPTKGVFHCTLKRKLVPLKFGAPTGVS